MLHKFVKQKSFWRLFGRCISHSRRWRFSHFLHSPMRGNTSDPSVADLHASFPSQDEAAAAIAGKRG
jgi:hypothetical protein